MIETLQALLSSERFVAFRIVLSSGSNYDVTSPLQVIVTGARVTYFSPRTDRKAFLNGIDISALETLEDNEFP